MSDDAVILVFPLCTRVPPQAGGFRPGDPVLVDDTERGHFLEALQPAKGEPLARVLMADCVKIARLSRVRAA